VRDFLKKAAIAVGATALSLGGVELGVRACDPFGISWYQEIDRFLDTERGAVVEAEAPLRYRLRENHVHRGAFTAHVNSLSLRGRETTREKPAHARRILFVGDSVTFGLGVDDASCFTTAVEDDLRASGHGDVEVLNGGCPGWNGVQEAYWLQKYGLGFEPDVVVLLFSADDPPHLLQPEELALQAKAVDSRLHRFFASPALDWLQTKQLMKHAYLLHLQRVGEMETVFALGGAGQHDDSVRIYLQTLDRILRFCTTRGARFAVVAGVECAWLRDHCGQAGIPYTFCGQAGLQDTPAELRLSATDAHPNARGHRLIADQILALLERHHLLDATVPK
jgi:lysophospholipase L1-like esterase